MRVRRSSKLANGAMREPVTLGILKLDNVTEPATITAVYGEQVAWTNIAIIAALPAVITVAYVIASRRCEKKHGLARHQDALAE
ncbi:MAG: hypothetical protein QXX87_04505 [Candidatus Jordarchaeales archaeon]